MKSIFFTMFLAICLLNFFSHVSNAAITCGAVDMKAATCTTFVTGKAPKPLAACCTGLQQLASSVKTVDDKKAICRCLKAAVKGMSGVQDRFLSQIPGICNIKVGFPVSLNTDCEKLN